MSATLARRSSILVGVVCDGDFRRKRTFGAVCTDAWPRPAVCKGAFLDTSGVLHSPDKAAPQPSVYYNSQRYWVRPASTSDGGIVVLGSYYFY